MSYRCAPLKLTLLMSMSIAAGCMQAVEPTPNDNTNVTPNPGGGTQNSNQAVINPNTTQNANNSTNGNMPTGNPSQNTNTVTGDQNQNVVPKPTPGASIRFMGRVDTVTDANNPIIAWPGSQIIVGFTGTQLTMTLVELDRSAYGGDNYFSITIDGAQAPRIKVSRTAQRYAVASGLAQGTHEVVLTKLTEAQIGRVQFLGATSDGTLAATSPVPVRRLEFIGDSGTAGYGAGGTSPCRFSEATEDASVAYPAVVATLLNADVHNISFSGKGIIANRDMVDDNYKLLPILWERTLPNDANMTSYSPNGWLPQAVVMTIGGNDFFNGIPTAASFNTKMTAFIKEIQALYAGVHVYLGASPMLRNDANPTQRETGIAYAQNLVASLADSRVHFIDLPPDLGANGYGCDQHMTPGTHRATANAIVTVLKAQFGW